MIAQIEEIGRRLHIVPQETPETQIKRAEETEERVEAVIQRVASLEARVQSLEVRATRTAGTSDGT
jgi:BMFP domain-containing protein YqiC